jgi:hypothetical protein
VQDLINGLPDFILSQVTCGRDVYLHTGQSCYQLENPIADLFAWKASTPPEQITWSSKYPLFGLSNEGPGAMYQLEGILESEVFTD